MSAVYEVITERIIALLEQGTVPWQKPWSGGEAPGNLISRKEYRGINVFLLGAAGYSSPWWLTFNQARDLGGSVKNRNKPKIGQEKLADLDALVQNRFFKRKIRFIILHSRSPKIHTRTLEPVGECGLGDVSIRRFR